MRALILAVVAGLAVVVGASALSAQPVPVPARSDIEGQPCMRDENQTVVWVDGHSYRCRYLPDPRTFEWQPAAPYMAPAPTTGG